MLKNIQIQSSAEISFRSDGVGFKHERAHVMVDTTSYRPSRPVVRSDAEGRVWASPDTLPPRGGRSINEIPIAAARQRSEQFAVRSLA